MITQKQALQRDSSGNLRDFTKEDFVNESGLPFVDISSESLRRYDWADGRSVTLEKPLWLNVSRSGGHRVWTASGTSHYIAPGWVDLSWIVGVGQPNFVK